MTRGLLSFRIQPAGGARSRFISERMHPFEGRSWLFEFQQFGRGVREESNHGEHLALHRKAVLTVRLTFFAANTFFERGSWDRYLDRSGHCLLPLQCSSRSLYYLLFAREQKDACCGTHRSVSSARQTSWHGIINGSRRRHCTATLNRAR